MSTRTRGTVPAASVKPASAGQRRKAEAQARAAAARRAARRRTRIKWTGVAVAAAALISGVILVGTRSSSAPPSTASAPAVGGDLHTVFVRGNALYMGGHDAVAVSHDAGRTFTSVSSLAGADAMGWASSANTVLMGGHPGLYRSTDAGATFTRVTGAGAVLDVHALGGTGNTLYLASPSAGLFASTDGGTSWQVRNAQVGRSFMGTILTDPANPARLIAPDMSAGLSTSSDGGRNWTALGGPAGAMAVTWSPTNTRQIVAVGMNGGALSNNGGASWQPVTVPAGTSALSYDPTGRTLYAGALNGTQAHTYRSTDNGHTWTPTA
jgi:hypothetical protein